MNHTKSIHPLQNRVDPLGDLIRTSARGAWMGNRGLIHNEYQEIVRPFRLKAWITCVLSFKSRHRAVMTPNLYTELFFLDEATAFSAGHRPCAECRRTDFNQFKTAWLGGNPLHHYNLKTRIGEIDEILHSERLKTGIKSRTFTEKLENLPFGTFVDHFGKPYIILAPDRVMAWTPFGYTEHLELSPSAKLDVLTPESIVNTFRSGYIPQIHETAR